MTLSIIPQSRQNNIVVQESGNEVLIYDLDVNKAFCLNQTSATIWSLCDGKNSVSEIADQSAKTLNTLINEELIWLALDELKKNNLIANPEQISSDYRGLTRRQVIQRVGIGTLAALPIITSLIAPTAAMAASPGGRSGACDVECTLQNACSCTSVTCPAGTTVAVNVGAGVCVTAAAAANAGISIAAGADGNVCLIANACVTVAL